jgi:hypothetical protein
LCADGLAAEGRRKIAKRGGRSGCVYHDFVFPGPVQVDDLHRV